MFESEVAKRILEVLERRAGPFKVQLNPTNRCNLKCRFCWLRDFDSGGLNLEELSTKKYLEIIRSCANLKVKVIEITGGGEPLMRKDILTLMKEIKKRKIFGRIITNGTLFTDKLIRALIGIGWDEIVFSLDAPVKEINDYLRGESFDKIVENLKKFQLMKMKRKKEKPMVSIHMVLCNKNLHLLPQMFEFVYNLNCRNLLVEPIVLLAKKTGAGKELLLKKKDRKALLSSIKKAIGISYKYNFQTNLDKLELEFFEKTSKTKIVRSEGTEMKNGFLSIPCYQPFYNMIIRPWGTVGICCMFDNVGDNVEDKNLEEIWFGKFFEEARKKMMKRIIPSFCSKCNPSQIQENRKIREELKKLIKW
jgi:MoaA/NifB/PqqE/SkfB family radical SAM enzyme